MSVSVAKGRLMRAHARIVAVDWLRRPWQLWRLRVAWSMRKAGNRWIRGEPGEDDGETRWDYLREDGLCGRIIPATDNSVESICVLEHPCAKHPDRRAPEDEPSAEPEARTHDEGRATVREESSSAGGAPTGPLGRSASEDALDDIVKILGAPKWDYPGQVVRDVAMAAGMTIEQFRERLNGPEKPDPWPGSETFTLEDEPSAEVSSAVIRGSTPPAHKANPEQTGDGYPTHSAGGAPTGPLGYRWETHTGDREWFAVYCEEKPRDATSPLVRNLVALWPEPVGADAVLQGAARTLVDALELGSRGWKVWDVLQAIDDAAWGARMDGGCHTRTSGILTVWARALRTALAATAEPVGGVIDKQIASVAAEIEIFNGDGYARKRVDAKTLDSWATRLRTALAARE